MARFFASCSAAIALLAAPAFAADLPLPVEPIEELAPAVGGIFGYLEGGYWLDGALDTEHGVPGTTVSTDAGDGGGFRGLLGYRFGNWDVALGGSYSRLSQGPSVPDVAGGDTWNVGPAEWYTIDPQLGYNFSAGAMETRIAVGARYAHLRLDVNDTFPATPIVVDDEYDGVGVMGSIDTRVGLGTHLGLLLGGQGSVVFGELNEDATGAAAPTPQTVDRTVWSVAGHAAADWRITDGASIALGYRAEYWDDPFFQLIANPGLSSGENDLFVHGPFGRLSFAW